MNRQYLVNGKVTFVRNLATNMPDDFLHLIKVDGWREEIKVPFILKNVSDYSYARVRVEPGTSAICTEFEERGQDFVVKTFTPYSEEAQAKLTAEQVFRKKFT